MNLRGFAYKVSFSLVILLGFMLLAGTGVFNARSIHAENRTLNPVVFKIYPPGEAPNNSGSTGKNLLPSDSHEGIVQPLLPATGENEILFLG